MPQNAPCIDVSSKLGQSGLFCRLVSFSILLSGSLRAGPMKASRLLFSSLFIPRLSILFSLVPCA
jgi:hypothetical protein